MVLNRDLAVRVAKATVAGVFLALAVRAFFGGHLLARFVTAWQAVPASLRNPFVAVPFFLVVTAVFGRIFCEMMCPLGILQSLAHILLHPRKPIRRVCTRLPESRRQRIVRWSIFALFVTLITLGFASLAWSIEPYSIFGRALTGLMPYPFVLAGILILAAATDGRIWCNWICPVGTIFNLVSRFAPFGNRICGPCRHCRKCFPVAKAPLDAAPEAKPDDVTRGAFVRGVAVLATAGALTDGEVVLPEAAAPASGRKRAVLPPGASRASDFSRKCLACGLCLSSCPTGVLSRSTDFRTYGQPQLDFSKGVCALACDNQCAKTCPAGALVPLVDVPRRDVHIGRAVWRADACLRTTEGIACTLCRRHCPVGAIHVVDGGIAVDDRLCIGCGICENGCAARPEPAIVVEGLDVHHVVRPMGERDLIAEMLEVLGEGKAVVVAQNGVIRAWESGHGVAPLMRLMTAGKLRDALVVDRVIGRAAAAICVCGGVRKVHALLMSVDADGFLRDHGIDSEPEKIVPRILQKNMKDLCPMEATVQGLSDPEEMVGALRRKIREMGARR